MYVIFYKSVILLDITQILDRLTDRFVNVFQMHLGCAYNVFSCMVNHYLDLILVTTPCK